VLHAARVLSADEQRRLLAVWGFGAAQRDQLCRGAPMTANALLERWTRLTACPSPPPAPRRPAGRALNGFEEALHAARGVLAVQLDAGQYDSGGPGRAANACLWLHGLLGYSNE